MRRHEWIEDGKCYFVDDADGGRLSGTPPSFEDAPAALPDYAEQLHRGRVMRAAAREILYLADRLSRLDTLLASEEPPRGLQLATCHGGRRPSESAWRWFREQFTTARESGLTQGGSMSEEMPETTLDPNAELAEQEAAGESAGSTTTDADPSDCA